MSQETKELVFIVFSLSYFLVTGAPLLIGYIQKMKHQLQEIEGQSESRFNGIVTSYEEIMTIAGENVIWVDVLLDNGKRIRAVDGTYSSDDIFVDRTGVRVLVKAIIGKNDGEYHCCKIHAI